MTLLIRETSPTLDAEYAAGALLAPLAAEVVLHQLHTQGMTAARIAGGRDRRWGAHR